MSERATQIVLGVAAALASDDPDLAGELTALAGRDSNEDVEATLRRAIERQHVVAFDYVGERRILSPYSIDTYGYSTGSYKLVLGYDHGRTGIRQFRTAAIKNLESAESAQLATRFREPIEEYVV